MMINGTLTNFMKMMKKRMILKNGINKELVKNTKLMSRASP